MKFSVVASFSGPEPDGWVPCDTTLPDAINAAGYIDEGFDPANDVSEPGESEYAYLALESCTCDGKRQDAARRLLDGWEDNMDADQRHRYTWLAEHGHDPENTECSSSGFWDRLQDFTVSGIVNRENLDSFLDRLGAWANEVETMGTLGGPLAPWGGIVSDVDFTIESQYLISCIRVTPNPERHGEPCNGAIAVALEEDRPRLAERYWQALRAGMLTRYGL